MSSFVQDLRFAARSFARRPGFSVVVVAILALGIGANTLIFSLVSGVLLEPLPYPRSERLFELETSWTEKVDGGLSPPEVLILRDGVGAFEHLAAYFRGEVNLTGGDQPLRVSAVAASADLFPTLGLETTLGRPYSADEDLLGAPPVVVLGHELWQTAFGGERGILGRQLLVDGLATTVVGVLAPGSRLPEDLREGGETALFMPLGLDPEPANYANGNHYLSGVARLREGLSRDQAQAELGAAIARMREERQFQDSLATFAVDLRPLHGQVVRGFDTTLRLLLAAVGLVLLITCANVANLLLARSEGRRREMAVRSALGAGRPRLLRQLLTESLLLAGAGGALGVLVASWGLDLVQAADAIGLPRLTEVRLDGRTLSFSLVAALATGVLFGILPAFQGSAEKERGHRSRATDGKARRLLVVTEVALAVVLVVGAGLVVRSLANLRHVDPGFDPRNLLTFSLSLSEATWADTEAPRFLEDLRQELEALPGVASAGAVTGLPLASRRGDWNFMVEGRALAPGELSPRGDWQVITPGYFETMQVPLALGRGFTASDDGAAPLVALVNQALAARYFPGTDPVGQHIRLGGNPDNPWCTIVGVVGDVRHRGLDVRPAEELYLPYGQWARASSRGAVRAMSFVLATTGDAETLGSAVRRRVAELAPELPLDHFATYDAIRNDALALHRFAFALLLAFAALALGLAAIGVFGVLSFQVSRRTREIGIRMALGATRSEVLRLIVGQGLGLSLVGVAIGLAGAVASTRGLESLLYGVSPQDPATFLAVGLILCLVAALASYLPARRAARLEPVSSLRHEGPRRGLSADARWCSTTAPTRLSRVARPRPRCVSWAPSSTIAGAIDATTPETSHRRSLPMTPRLRSTLLAASTTALLLGFAPAPARASDAPAVALAEKTLAAMGGQAAWDATRYLRFTFAGFRTHHWDKHSGRYRLEGKTREGESYVVLMDLGSRQGQAWKNGEAQTGSELATWLERAWGAWVNDTYWLLMPYKLLDPGVNLAYEGQDPIDGKAREKIRLTFGQVGLTPGDTYWVWFDPETHLVVRWSYVLEGFEPGQAATAWDWGGWQKFGEILLAPDRKMVGGDRQLPLSDLAVFESLPDSVFSSAAPISP